MVKNRFKKNKAIHAFYVSAAWRRKRAEVLRRDKNECQNCKAKGKYTPATHVHHVMHYDKHPELGLSDTYLDGGVVKQNLISLCFACHAEIHQYGVKRKDILTVERW